MDGLAIDVRALAKRYGETEALRGLTFGVPRGSLCGFLGRNGAGKTTTLKLLLGMARPSAGEGFVLGRRIDVEAESVAIRRETAFVSESKDLYPFTTVEQMIRIARGACPGWRADLESKYLKLFELKPKQKVSALSRGNLTRLNLLLALSRGARLLLLDEPTQGLDTVVREEVLQALVGYVATEEATIFLSSHELHEVEQICDRVVIIDHGRALLEGELDDLKGNFRRVRATFPQAPPANSWNGVRALVQEGRTVSMLVSGHVDDVVARARSMEATAVAVDPVTLKEIFLDLVRPDDPHA
jgi:ABC-2 type transport system ATP-binding protein